MQHEFVGRGAELQAVHAFLDRVATGPCALLIEGEPGIGKTTLWHQTVRAGESRGYRVLQARPAESELNLSFAAIADLLGAAFDEMRGHLPAPQERAMGAALLRLDPEEPSEPRTTATALVSVFTTLARERPLLVAVDDVQWLDRASQRALAFAVRRLPERLGLVVTRRGAGGDEAPLGLARALPADQLRRLVPGPLSLAGLQQILSSRLGMSFPRPLLARIAEASGGNPLFALEIAQATMRGKREPSLDDPLAVPSRLDELMGDRVRTLSDPAREAVRVAAFLSRPTAATIVEALGPNLDGRAALGEAEEAGVLVAERERVRFTHPLLASVVYGSTSRGRRLELHRRLAQLVADPEERARHVAASTTEPDEATAAQVEDGARQAELRGAQDAAAELFEASCRLTPDGRPNELSRRLMGGAAALQLVGDLADARARAEQAVATAVSPALRAEALWVLAVIEWDAGAINAACEHLEKALPDAAGDRALQSRILSWLAWMSVTTTAPLSARRALVDADAAIQLLREDREPERLAEALFRRVLAEALLGRDPPRELLEKGLALEAGGRPHPIPLLWFQYVDAFDAARTRYAAEDHWYREHGEDRLYGNRLGELALVELWAGQWHLAEQHAELGCTMADHPLVSGPPTMPFASRSLVDAHRGRVERGRSTLLPLIDEAERTGKAWWAANLLSALGFVEFAAGEHEAADQILTRMHDWVDSMGIVDALFDRSEPFHIESLVTLGELDRARTALERLEERGRALPRRWIVATLPRARALLLAAEGELQGALKALSELDPDAASALPFELGCTLLLEGRMRRRANQKRAAAGALQRASELFEQLGAPRWLQQASDEFTRIGLRHRSPDELTATEQQIAQLAAAGLTNREVAKAAFVSPKTVEANLARVYRKLGIRSRAELGARMHELETHR
jgi:ATP/maltotriose-dependent transcriptional regulator MalT